MNPINYFSIGTTLKHLLLSCHSCLRTVIEIQINILSSGPRNCVKTFTYEYLNPLMNITRSIGSVEILIEYHTLHQKAFSCRKNYFANELINFPIYLKRHNDV